MAKSIYSFGEESPLKFEISDKLAERYNQAAKEMYRAQQRFNQKFGRNWNPAEKPIRVKWSVKQGRAWNEMAARLAKLVEETGPYHPNDFMDDYLVKNPVKGLLRKWEHGPAIPLAVAAGVLYVLLSRR